MSTGGNPEKKQPHLGSRFELPDRKRDASGSSLDIAVPLLKRRPAGKRSFNSEANNSFSPKESGNSLPAIFSETIWFQFTSCHIFVSPTTVLW